MSLLIVCYRMLCLWHALQIQPSNFCNVARTSWILLLFVKMNIENTLKEFTDSLAVIKWQVWWQSMVLLETTVEGMIRFEVGCLRCCWKSRVTEHGKILWELSCWSISGATFSMLLQYFVGNQVLICWDVAECLFLPCYSYGTRICFS